MMVGFGVRWGCGIETHPTLSQWWWLVSDGKRAGGV